MALQLLLASELPRRDETARPQGVHAPLAAHGRPGYCMDHTVWAETWPSALPTPTTVNTFFPLKSQPGITSSRKFALTIPQPLFQSPSL